MLELYYLYFELCYKKIIYSFNKTIYLQEEIIMSRARSKRSKGAQLPLFIDKLIEMLEVTFLFTL
jgi:hypothetical protein